MSRWKEYDMKNITWSCSAVRKSSVVRVSFTKNYPVLGKQSMNYSWKKVRLLDCHFMEFWNVSQFIQIMMAYSGNTSPLEQGYANFQTLGIELKQKTWKHRGRVFPTGGWGGVTLHQPKIFSFSPPGKIPPHQIFIPHQILIPPNPPPPPRHTHTHTYTH